MNSLLLAMTMMSLMLILQKTDLKNIYGADVKILCPVTGFDSI